MSSYTDSVRKNRRTIVLTVGHSNHALEQFIAIVQAHGVSGIIDIRTITRSRHNPQFNKEELPLSLSRAGIGYVHLPGLGGLRHSLPNSANTGWHNASFRGYADYMQTPEFAEALAALIALAETGRRAIMCAEALPWRCHRSLVADALIVCGIQVEHILSRLSLREHRLTPFATVCDGRITYAAQ